MLFLALHTEEGGNVAAHAERAKAIAKLLGIVVLVKPIKHGTYMLQDVRGFDSEGRELRRDDDGNFVPDSSEAKGGLCPTCGKSREFCNFKAYHEMLNDPDVKTLTKAAAFQRSSFDGGNPVKFGAPIPISILGPCPPPGSLVTYYGEKYCVLGPGDNGTFKAILHQPTKSMQFVAMNMETGERKTIVGTMDEKTVTFNLEQASAETEAAFHKYLEGEADTPIVVE